MKLKKGDFIYVPQNTRFLKEHEGRTTTDRTEQPLRGMRRERNMLKSF